VSNVIGEYEDIHNSALTTCIVQYKEKKYISTDIRKRELVIVPVTPYRY
jgi:hypothetical protein